MERFNEGIALAQHSLRVPEATTVSWVWAEGENGEVCPCLLFFLYVGASLLWLALASFFSFVQHSLRVPNATTVSWVWAEGKKFNVLRLCDKSCLKTLSPALVPANFSRPLASVVKLPKKADQRRCVA